MSASCISILTLRRSCLCERTLVGLSYFQHKGANEEFTWSDLQMRELRLGGHGLPPPQQVTESAPESQEGIQIIYLESLLSEGGVPGTGVAGVEG